MISIVIPCYNCEKTLNRTVDSIIKQSFPEWELILVNDGSNDGTKAICDLYEKSDRRIHVIHQENLGLMKAWKNGVDSSIGDYIAFCDSDDYYDLCFIERVNKIVAKYDIDVYAYGMVMEYSDNRVLYCNNMIKGYFTREQIEKELYPIIFPHYYTGQWAIIQPRVTKIYSRTLLDSIMDFLPDYVSQGEDNLTTFATIMNAKTMFVEDDYAPYHYVRNNDSMIGKYDCNWYDKLLVLNREMRNLARKCNYPNIERVEIDFCYNSLVYLKKEFTRNRESIPKMAEKAKRIRENGEFDSAFGCMLQFKLPLSMSCFCWLFFHKQYYLICLLTLIADKMKFGHP